MTGIDDVDDLQIGKAGEYLVCADLILKGYIAYPSEQGLHYDIVCDINGQLLRIQVKTTRKPMKMPQTKRLTMKYRFDVRRMGKGGRKRYDDNTVDIFALVTLDTKSIGYVPIDKVKTVMFFLPEGIISIRDVSEKKEKIKQLNKEGLTLTEISKQLAVDRYYANRVIMGKEEGSIPSPHLSDWRFEDALQ